MGLLINQARRGPRRESALMPTDEGTAAPRSVGIVSPLRARDSLQRLVENCIGQDIFVSLVVVAGLLIHAGILPLRAALTGNPQ